MKVYPYQVPAGMHPLAFLFLGFGLEPGQINQLCRHLFDGLGVRFCESEPVDVHYSWAVDWPFEGEGRFAAEKSQSYDEPIPGGDKHGVRLKSGHLPPGIRLEKHTGRLVGVFEEPGLYEAVISVGTHLKYDPLGTAGTPSNPGEWIPHDQPRHVPEVAPVPTKLDELDPRELDELLVKIQEAQRAKLIREADDGN